MRFVQSDNLWWVANARIDAAGGEAPVRLRFRTWKTRRRAVIAIRQAAAARGVTLRVWGRGLRQVEVRRIATPHSKPSV